MASPAGRGAQVRLDGDAQAAARGGLGTPLAQTMEAKRVLEYTGAVADGTTRDGSTKTGTAAEDEVLAPAGASVGGSYTLPAATASVLGGVKGGTGWAIAGDGTASVNYGTTAGTATQGNDARITGAAQKSANLSDLQSVVTARTNLGLAAVAQTGAYGDLSGTPAAYILPTASTSVLGGVKVDGSTVTITAGVISASGGGGGTVAGYSSSAPELLRGTTLLRLVPGVVPGSVSGAQRINNGTNLQAAITAAVAAGRFIEDDSNLWEVNLAGGLIFDGGGLTFRGHVATEFKQFATNTPSVVLGTRNASGNGAFGMDIDMLTGSFGVSQAGNTSAIGIQMGSSWMSKFSRLYAGGGSFKPYYSILFYDGGGGSDPWWFSNLMENCKFDHAQSAGQIWKHALLSTGNVYNNVYCGGGNPTITPYTGTVVSFDEGGGRGQGSVFNQFNIEWSQGNRILAFNSCRNFVFNGLHLEGCSLTGSNASFLYHLYSEVTYTGMDFENCKSLAANGVSGGALIFAGYGDGQITAINPRFGWLTPDLADTNVDLPLYLTSFASEAEYMGKRVELRQMYWEGPNAMAQMRTDLVTGDAPFPTRGNYVEDGMGQWFDNVLLDRTADFTVYGCLRNPTVRYPAGLAANRTVTLSDRIGSTGWSANAKVPTGALIHIYRAAGTATNSLIVKNLTSGGTTLTTNTTADAKLRYRFDGTNWVAM